jgi:hypothetical protein
MFTWLKDFCSFWFKSYSVLAAFAIVALSGIAMAAGEPEIEVTTPTLSWGTVASDLVAALTQVAVVGLGIAISIWVLFTVAKVFKRSSGQ